MTPIPLLGPEIYEGIEDLGLKPDVFGWNSLHPFFEEILEKVRPTTIIEVGTWKGASAINMAHLSAKWTALETVSGIEMPAAPKIYCVDHWIGGADHIRKEVADKQGVMRDAHGWPGVYYQFLHNVKACGFAKRIVPIPMVSWDAAQLLKAHGVKAQLIYIDAGHEFGDCFADICAFRETVLAPGGVMFGDDYDRQPVKDAVAKAADDFGEVVEAHGNFWSFAQRAAA